MLLVLGPWLRWRLAQLHLGSTNYLGMTMELDLANAETDVYLQLAKKILI